MALTRPSYMRGFTVTGLVLDLAVLSSYRQACSCAKARFGGSETAKFHAWFRSHENDCNKNYTGSAGSMEVTAAEIMWGRMVFKGFRYTTMVSDGDARTFRHLSDLKVYGEDVTLAKEECINRPGAERLIALLDFEAFDDPGSNDRRLSEDTAMHFECLLADCEGWTCEECGKVFRRERDKLLEYEYCEKRGDAFRMSVGRL